MLMASKPASANDDLLAHLRKHFRMKDLGQPRFILGMHVDRPSLHHITSDLAITVHSQGRQKVQLNGHLPAYSSYQGRHPLQQR